MQFVFCTQLFTEKNVHFTSPDDAVLKIPRHCFLFLQNAYKCSCSPRTYVVEVVPEHLYIAMMDSLRQQFFPRMRQAGRDRKISDRHKKGYFCPTCENGRFHSHMFVSIPAYPSSWNSRLLKVQKYDNKQNFDCKVFWLGIKKCYL